MSLRRWLRWNAIGFRCRRGAVTVEAAIVMIPFLLLTMMTLEVGVIDFMQSNFQAAVYQTARLIRTGEESTLDTAAYGTSPTNAQQLGHLVQDICQYENNLDPVAGTTNAASISCAAAWSQSSSAATGETAVVLSAISSFNPTSPFTPVSGTTASSNAALVGSEICDASYAGTTSTTTCSTATTSTSFVASCQIGALQAFRRWPIFVPLDIPFLNSGFPTSNPGFLLSATSIFKVENSSSSSCGGITS